jgi:hypothetical protein
MNSKDANLKRIEDLCTQILENSKKQMESHESLQKKITELEKKIENTEKKKKKSGFFSTGVNKAVDDDDGETKDMKRKVIVYGNWASKLLYKQLHDLLPSLPFVYSKEETMVDDNIFLYCVYNSATTPALRDELAMKIEQDLAILDDFRTKNTTGK